MEYKGEGKNREEEDGEDERESGKIKGGVENWDLVYWLFLVDLFMQNYMRSAEGR